MKKRYIIVLLLLAAGFLFANPYGVYAQKLTHTVQEGDTLWDICEEYYGDPNLWPKLWEMNEFITNPHLIKPGDVITLFEQEPVEEVAEVKEEEKVPPSIEEEPEPEMVGIDLTSLTKADTLGFLSTEKITPWGTLFASNNENMILSEGDTAYILFDKSKDIGIGDEFSIGESSPLLKHPVTGKDLGYTFLVKGKLVVEERLGLARKGIDEFYQKKNVFKTRLVEVYEPIRIDDSVLPYRSVSPCVVPVSLNRETVANIVAAKAERMLIEPGSIVYIDLGLKDGVRRGNVFDVVEADIVPDPQPETSGFFKDVIILPDRSVGKIMVLESRTDTSTAIVISADEPSSPGIYIVGLTWQEVPDFLSSMLDCPAE
jgi:hypothetical protein